MIILGSSFAACVRYTESRGKLLYLLIFAVVFLLPVPIIVPRYNPMLWFVLFIPFIFVKHETDIGLGLLYLVAVSLGLVTVIAMFTYSTDFGLKHTYIKTSYACWNIFRMDR